MAVSSGMVVTDGRVMLGSDLDVLHDLIVIPRDVEINGQTLSSDDRANTIRALTLESAKRGRAPRVAPSQREHFLAAYGRVGEQQTEIVSIHLHAALDDAARQARICRRLLQPHQQVHVYEAKALEGGLSFVLHTALTLTQEGATATQLLALLRYLETHMHTLLLTPGAVRSQHLMVATTVQQLRGSLPGTETLWHLDPKAQTMQVLQQGRRLAGQVGQLLQARWGTLRYAARIRYRGYAKPDLDHLVAGLRAAGCNDAIEIEPVTATFVPGMPPSFIELLLLPTEHDLRRLRGLVQDPVWWKGTI
jgi:hypothetical protein